MKKILIVVDYQKDFVDGTLGFEGAKLLDAPIADRIREYGRGNVFFTRDTHFDDYLSTREGKFLPVAHCIKGSDGWQIYGETAKALDEVGAVGFDKAAFGLDMTDDVRALLPDEVDEIELCGLVSNICVISNAVVFQSAYPNAKICIDSSLTASFDSALHEKVLDVLRGLQVTVL